MTEKHVKIIKNVVYVICVQYFESSELYFEFSTFADNLLMPMSSKMSMSFFLQSKRN